MCEKGYKTDFACTTDDPLSSLPSPLSLSLYVKSPDFTGITDMTFSDRKHRRSPKALPLLAQKAEDVEHAEGGFDGASYSGAVFNLSTTIVGAGIMALPATLKQLGTIPGLVVILFASMLTEKSISILLRFSKASKTASYSGLAGDTFGDFGRTLLQVCIVVNNVGTLVVYMIIIGL